ncbi:hypothetical protein SODALDRAFT_359818 [Sodiomyces alkalinus F11]|uniref:Uncharacterized protein n=1 Tax=Sodiomyces alkalinus (strain CBS 110278 / VKM F-3762 / F11) TaxID=1314773 RepID=A0A3N2PW64_SODAK|nr:hypothetical protein SODALDRAFT_359818 [Sodiomyces alkalinus F11]ROT38717.1 hypothetical protein SODALDRAFT_359818 [Sodiomyces alkalinus F11]
MGKGDGKQAAWGVVGKRDDMLRLRIGFPLLIYLANRKRCSLAGSGYTGTIRFDGRLFVASFQAWVEDRDPGNLDPLACPTLRQASCFDTAAKLSTHQRQQPASAPSGGSNVSQSASEVRARLLTMRGKEGEGEMLSLEITRMTVINKHPYITPPCVTHHVGTESRRIDIYYMMDWMIRGKRVCEENSHEAEAWIKLDGHAHWRRPAASFWRQRRLRLSYQRERFGNAGSWAVPIFAVSFVLGKHLHMTINGWDPRPGLVRGHRGTDKTDRGPETAFPSQSHVLYWRMACDRSSFSAALVPVPLIYVVGTLFVALTFPSVLPIREIVPLVDTNSVGEPMSVDLLWAQPDGPQFPSPRFCWGTYSMGFKLGWNSAQNHVYFVLTDFPTFSASDH